MKKSADVWVIDDDKSIRWVLEKALTQGGFNVTCYDSANGILAKLNQQQPQVIMSDIRMPGMDGFTLLEKLHDLYPHIPVIIMTAYSDLESAVAAYQGGAFEYLPKPFDVDDAAELVRRAIQKSEESSPTPEIDPNVKASEIIGSAPAMQEVFRAIGRLSRSNITVLITGDSGTGKELVARALHRHSPRAEKPFIALNTAAIPRELLESELFGHERGAFTGALTQRRGRFEQADMGTLFLDEIGDMPAELQTRLLRVLADGTFFRVGGHTPLKVDVRIIAATHQNLELRVQESTFREDLYHRLNVIRIHLPPLRKRREDIPALMRHFLLSAARELSVEVKTLHANTERYLTQLDWPGNVRQLENACRWLTVMASGQEILLDDLPPELRLPSVQIQDRLNWEESLNQWVEQRLALGEEGLLNDALPRFETVMINTALKYTGGRRQEAAKLLGWGRNTLTRKIKELGMGEETE
ncbi:nitrogen regulation protein NR(I) [Beggiatoa leptomitoformis]|uniref:DNA-binding transcriptional regulator NtrC n=1 Tax=Beggiatoa leptomitoformis TaxID=288004 RepID=A0A2N9YIX7_9GAMM|nr:nitrogen regulation protein NR(I) [Beggiatoa leptomitoformis]ALG67601.1 nitrogen regulation protein NR(I) [Beggiatoa leptomitoformis]AUI70166.1 nitrogen regulation protein NR(I) [Beggiatoa leptomitoformis]